MALKLIVGLGNPGKKYADTRHNVGFRAVKAIADKHHISSRYVHRVHSLLGKGIINGKRVILAQPTTYMNNSGRAVKALIGYFNIDSLEDIIIVYDDMDLSPGVMRIKTGGSSGGHNGLKSIINRLETQEFPRIRIGIGHPEGVEVTDYVLGYFTPSEEKEIELIIDDVVNAVEVILEEGYVQAMNKYN